MRTRRSKSLAPSRKGLSQGSCYAPDTRAYRSAWQETIKAAEEANDPAVSPPSSAMSGPRIPAATIYTAMSSSGMAATRRRVDPFSVVLPMGSDNPRDLWKWLEAYEAKTGGDVLAIAHNGNLSNGRHVPDH